MTSDAVEIRLLTVADLAVLDRVEDDVFDFAVRPVLAAQYLSTPGNLLAVAICSGVVVGMASAVAYLHPDKPLQLFINEVGVSDRMRGQGIGKRLMHTLLERGRTLGCTEAWVATEVNNKAARALYDAVAGTEDQDQAVVYTWKLSDPVAGAKIGDS
jgi:ribosomal protein S18 acetylase RimI-like enzyme